MTTVDLAPRIAPRHAVYVTRPSAWRYQGRHRRTITLERLAAGLMLGTVVLGFAAVGVITMIWPR